MSFTWRGPSARCLVPAPFRFLILAINSLASLMHPLSGRRPARVIEAFNRVIRLSDGDAQHTEITQASPCANKSGSDKIRVKIAAQKFVRGAEAPRATRNER